MNDDRKEGAAATLKAVVVIVIVGVLLGVGYNALGLQSRPPRGLSWITKVEKLPSLEDLQPAEPGKGPGSLNRPGDAPGALLARLAGVAPAEAATLAAAADSAHAKPAVKKRAKKTAAKPGTKTSAAKPAAKSPAAAPAAKSAGAPPAAAPAASAPVDLPTVPDLSTPIEVKIANVKKFFDAKAAVFVDAREAPEYAEGHIAGAASVPFDDAVATPALLDPFKNAGKPVIVYCSGGDCELSKNLANNMLAAGIHKVLVFTDGFPAWKAAGYPVETGAAKAGR